VASAGKPTAGADCPAELTKPARAEWNRLLPELTRLGILTVLDRAAFAAYCEAWSDFKWAVEEIEHVGRTAKGCNGVVFVHPAVQIKKQAMQKIREFSAEFGLTPLARPRIDMTSPEDAADNEFFLRGPRSTPPPPPRKDPA
jgi:P27 family predicted phage terminase small subunit